MLGFDSSFQITVGESETWHLHSKFILVSEVTYFG